MTITHDDIIRSLEALSPDEMEVFLARLQERAGISLPAAAPPPFVTMGAPPPLMGALETEQEWDLHLLDHGPDKIAVIRVARELRGLGLKETKELVESAPVVLVEGLSRSQGQEAAARLEQAGAKVALR